MNYETGAELLINAIKGFHDDFQKIYGQISLRLDNNNYISTGGNKLISEITEDDFIICDINTGDLGKLFNSLPDVNVWIFACTECIVNTSDSLEYLSPSLEDMAHLVGDKLDILPDASPETIIQRTNKTGIFLVKGMGAIALETNLKKAVAAINIVEKSCEAHMYGKIMNGPIPIDSEIMSKLRNYFISQYVTSNQEPDVYYIGFDEEEFAKRTELIEYGKKLVKSGLAYGSWGNLSLRLNEDEMLIKPTSIDYFEIKPEDIVKVNINTLEYGDFRKPSTETNVHAKLYRDFPNCNAVMHTHSNAISTFAASEAGFMWGDNTLSQTIGNVETCEYAMPGSDELAENVCNGFSNTHALIISHHGGIFYADNLETAFDVANAVEQRAKSIILSSIRASSDAEDNDNSDK